jgi:predicted N-acyltransferase
MIEGISEKNWSHIRPSKNPFLGYDFFSALKQSQSIGSEAGWVLKIIRNANEDAALYYFEKTHSYGEYIFDWQWAKAFYEYGVNYYPKLTSMLPFTPVTTTHFLMETFNEDKAIELLIQYEETYKQGNYSSSHFLFLNQNEINLFESQNYLIRESIQYHFFNKSYLNFDHFLESLKGRKAKQIRGERRHPELEITSYTGEALTLEHAERMYNFYISTIQNKKSFNYLNLEFFKIIFRTMKDKILYTEATRNKSPVAGSLFFYDHETIYGRYWGSTEYIENLHFELCYYQGIDFCIKHELKKFEAGAQGEHKISRGFRPIRTYSAHKIKHPAFREAIKNFIESEKEQIAQTIHELSKSLPFKESDTDFRC